LSVKNSSLFFLVAVFIGTVVALIATLWLGYKNDVDLLQISDEYHLSTIERLDEMTLLLEKITDAKHHPDPSGVAADVQKLNNRIGILYAEVANTQGKYAETGYGAPLENLGAVLKDFRRLLKTPLFERQTNDAFEQRMLLLKSVIQALKTPHVDAYKTAFKGMENQRQTYLLIVVFGGIFIFATGVLVINGWMRQTRDNLETLKKTQQQHIDSGNWLRAVIENTAEGMVIIDDRGGVISFNNAACNMFGYDASEVIGQNVSMLMPENDRKQHDAYVRQSDIVAPRIINQSRDLFGLRKDGSLFPMSLNVSLMETFGRKTFIGIMRDISDRYEADKLKAEFVSTVSHELRTPLTSIKGALGLIRSGAVGDVSDAAREMLEIAYSNSERLTTLINDILDLEKIEAGKMVFNLKPMDIVPLVKTALIENKSFADGFAVTFTGHGLDQHIDVNGDADRLMQVLTNLLSNAAKFSSRGGDVEILVKKEGEKVRIAVQDHGPGIPEDFRDQIFGKFTQADGADNRAKGGTGLGLNISRAIADAHGGIIDFDSVEGEGACFYLELPVHTNTVETRDDELPQSGLRILICEDEPDIGSFLKVLLASAGYRTEIATSAEAAKEMLKVSHFDAMTLDLGLPGQDGISFIRDLRSHPSTHDLPVIVVSASADEGKAQLNGPAVHIIDWMQKPVDTELLLRSLDETLRKNRDGKPAILHVEDDPNIVEIVSVLVGDLADVDAAMSLESARTLLGRKTYDLVILDLMLPDGRGEELLPLFNRAGSYAIPVIIFSSVDNTDDVVDAVNAVLVKTQTSNEQLLDVIRSTVENHAHKEGETHAT